MVSFVVTALAAFLGCTGALEASRRRQEIAAAALAVYAWLQQEPAEAVTAKKTVQEETPQEEEMAA